MQNNWLSHKSESSGVRQVWSPTTRFNLTRDSKVRQATGVQTLITHRLFWRPFLNCKLKMTYQIYCHWVSRLIWRFYFPFAVLIMVYKTGLQLGQTFHRLLKRNRKAKAKCTSCNQKTHYKEMNKTELWDPMVHQWKTTVLNVILKTCNFLFLIAQSYPLSIYLFVFKTSHLVTTWMRILCVLTTLCSTLKSQWVTGSLASRKNILVLKLRGLFAD